MNPYIKKFIWGLVIFTSILGALAYVLFFVIPGKYFSPVLPYMFPFFFLLTFLIFFILTRNTASAFSNFVNRFMIAVFGKMIVCIILLLAYVFTHRPDAVPFIISFFILYILFSVYEVVALLKYPFPGKK
jgi:hypothetical protein